MEWMILPLRRYAQFRGRSRRKEYWMFVLFVVIMSVILPIVDSMLGLGGFTNAFSNRSATGIAAGARTSGGILSALFSLAILVPSIALGVRRLHDIDRTGWWVVAPYGLFLLGLALTFTAGAGIMLGPIVGAFLFPVGALLFVILLVWACMDGTRGSNRFGPDPKAGLGDLEATFR